jgi:hypothetical protein
MFQKDGAVKKLNVSKQSNLLFTQVNLPHVSTFQAPNARRQSYGIVAQAIIVWELFQSNQAIIPRICWHFERHELKLSGKTQRKSETKPNGNHNA